MFESRSEEEADAEEAGGTNPVVDVEDLGNIMRHMKKAKVLLLTASVQLWGLCH